MAQFLRYAREVPDITWRYWGIYEFMRDNPFIYGTEERRTEAHQELCQHYGITKETSLSVTNHMDRMRDATDLHFALKKLPRTLKTGKTNTGDSEQ